MIPPQNFRIVVKQLAHNENGYRDVLKEIFMSESNLIVLDCEKKILEEVLKQCQQVITSFQLGLFSIINPQCDTKIGA